MKYNDNLNTSLGTYFTTLPVYIASLNGCLLVEQAVLTPAGLDIWVFGFWIMSFESWYSKANLFGK